MVPDLETLNVETLWRPHPGPQTVFLAAGEFEALYGGAAGGGKSDALLYGGLRQIRVPRYRALLLRQSFPELRDLSVLLPLGSSISSPMIADTA